MRRPQITNKTALARGKVVPNLGEAIDSGQLVIYLLEFSSKHGLL